MRRNIFISFSCKTFGVVEEKRICIVVDVQEDTEIEFQFYIEILTSLIKEQLVHCQKLNLIRFVLGVMYKIIYSRIDQGKFVEDSL